MLSSTIPLRTVEHGTAMLGRIRAWQCHAPTQQLTCRGHSLNGGCDASCRGMAVPCRVGKNGRATPALLVTPYGFGTALSILKH